MIFWQLIRNVQVAFSYPFSELLGILWVIFYSFGSMQVRILSRR
jgi:hypothetical protein